jgi:hypothetical protein
MKRAAILGVFVLSVFLIPLPAQAAIVEVDVTIKAVDAKARGITVVYKTDLGEKTIDLDVSRKAEITVNGKEGTLDSLGEGLKAKVSYDKDLAVVTKLEATGVATKRKAPELVELSELNDEANNAHAWLSEDGLTIYWDRTLGRKGTIWTAHREKPESPFGDKKSLFSGMCPTVSSGGLEMILVGDRTDEEAGMSLHVATRESLDKPFSRPKEIASLHAWSPCLSADGLTLYFCSRSFQSKTCYFTRRDKESPWSKAKVYDPPGFEDSNVSLSFITPDGLTLFGSSQKPSLVMLSRTSIKRPFQKPMQIEVNNRPLFGNWPRYVSATQELFFWRIPLKDGRWDKTRPVGIWVIKNFTLPDASN